MAASWSSGIEPSARGPTLMRRLPFLLTTSTSSRISCAPDMERLASSSWLYPKEYPSPRVASQTGSMMSGTCEYSRVRKPWYGTPQRSLMTPSGTAA